MQGKVMSEQSAPVRPVVHLGIDVCKATLDVHVLATDDTVDLAFAVDNSKKGIKTLIKQLAAYAVKGIAMEATGKYHRDPHRRLHDVGYAVTVVNPMRARQFAYALGTVAKTDQVDARLLARFARSGELKTTPPPPEVLEALQEIVRSREAAVAAHTALTNQYKAATIREVKLIIKRQMGAAKEAAKALAARAAAVVTAQPELARRRDILVSIPGIGMVTAIGLIANFPELGTCSSKQCAMLAGVAPIARDSGTTKGHRAISGGRPQVRTGTYMAAVSAIVHNADLRRFYNNLVGRGKVKKVALTAVIRKLLVLANSLLAADRIWSLKAPIAKPLSSLST